MKRRMKRLVSMGLIAILSLSLWTGVAFPGQGTVYAAETEVNSVAEPSEAPGFNDENALDQSESSTMSSSESESDNSEDQIDSEITTDTDTAATDPADESDDKDPSDDPELNDGNDLEKPEDQSPDSPEDASADPADQTDPEINTDPDIAATDSADESENEDLQKAEETVNPDTEAETSDEPLPEGSPVSKEQIADIVAHLDEFQEMITRSRNSELAGTEDIPQGLFSFSGNVGNIDDVELQTHSDAITGEQGNITWEYAAGTLTFSGKGAIPDYDGENDPVWRQFESEAKIIVIKSGITSVGSGAFCEFSSLETLTIPKSMTSLGVGAFANCYSLNVINGGQGLKTVGDYAFQGSSLTEFNVGPSLTSLGSRAFSGSSYLVRFTGGNSTYQISDGVVYSDAGKTLYIVPAGMSGSFSIPSTVTNIADGAFAFNEGLTSITIPNSVTSLGESAFQSCGALESILIPDSVKEAGYFTFYGCSSLKSVTFGQGLKTAPYMMFENCRSLESVDLGGLSELDNRCFTYCETLKDLTIPASIKEIGAACFGECTALETVRYEASIDYIPYQCFFNCWSLKNLEISEGIRYIYTQSFYGCSSLASVSIPASVLHSYDGAFPDTTVLDVKNSALVKYGTNGYYFVDQLSLSGKVNYEKAYEVLTLVNKERAAQGLNKLYMDQDLLNAAVQRSAETAVLFSHTRPDGTSCFSASDKMRAENIAAGQTTASAVMESWMNSDGHRENILGSDYKSIGIGCFTNNGMTYWVQCFGVNKLTSNFSKPSNAKKTFNVKLYFEEFDEYVEPGSFFFGDLQTYNYSFAVQFARNGIPFGTPTTASLYVNNPGFAGVQTKLNNKNLVWKSKNESIASIDSSTGKITTNSKGKATISVKTPAHGTIKSKLTVKARSLSDATVKGLNNLTYNGKARTQKITVKLTLNGTTTTLIQGTDYDITYSNNKDVGTATVTINGKGQYTGTATKTFKILPKGTSIESLQKAKKAITVNWTKQKKKMSSSRITGYQIQLATDTEFTKNLKSVVVKGYSETSSKITDLKGGKKYYVRIRTYMKVNGKNYYSPWSEVKSVKTKS